MYRNLSPVALFHLYPVSPFAMSGFTHHYHHHHHIALLPNTYPGLPLWGFVTITFLLGCIVSPRPTPNLEDQVSVFMTPGDRVAQLYPQVLGTHFSRFLRRAWVTVGLFFNPGHYTGGIYSSCLLISSFLYSRLQFYCDAFFCDTFICFVRNVINQWVITVFILQFNNFCIYKYRSMFYPCFYTLQVTFCIQY
jgi:hypothetical protein